MAATAQDMEDVVKYAEARGIKAKFWDAQKRWLILTRADENSASVGASEEKPADPAPQGINGTASHD